QRHQGARDRETGIQMAAGAAAGEEDAWSGFFRERPRLTHRDCGVTDGSVALLPMIRSRVLPIFTRIPVNNIVSTRLERPYETKGSVRPVVGNKPITTPTCRYAVRTVTKVRPTATSCRNGERALRAMRNPSTAYNAKA